MKKAAFILVMCVRLVALVSVILGIALWSGKVSPSGAVVPAHIGLGFLMVVLVLAMGVVGIVAKQYAPGALAIVAALCLPATGFMQLATIGPNFGGPQIGHIVVVLAAIGLAEAIAARVKRAA